MLKILLNVWIFNIIYFFLYQRHSFVINGKKVHGKRGGVFVIIPLKCKNEESYVNMNEESKRELNIENIWTTIYF